MIQSINLSKPDGGRAIHPIISILRMHAKDRMSWFYVGWLFACGSAFLVNLLIAIWIGHGFPTGGLSSIYLYMLVWGMLTVRGTFAFALGLNVRRLDYLLGTIFMALLTSAGGVLLTLMAGTVEQWTHGWFLGLSFFHVPYFSDGDVLVQFWVGLAVMAHLYFSGFVMGCVYQRFQRAGVVVMIVVGGALMTIGSYALTYYNVWPTIGAWLVTHTAFDLSLWLTPFTLFYIVCTFLLLRRSTVA
jgi:hypothetical protein